MTPRQPFVSYAQNGEDVVLARALRPDERPGFWIDVGAGHPYDLSVTAAFAERGWRGVNVEPHEPLHAALVRERPADVNLRVALGSEPGSATLWVTERHLGLSTTTESVRERMLLAGDHLNARSVAKTTLAAICEEHASGTTIDFLKIDVEGAEAEVLAGGDWERWRPRVVVIEAVLPETQIRSEAAWEHVLIDAGYECSLFDGLNLFYSRADQPALAESLAVPANPSDAFVTIDDVRRRHARDEARRLWKARQAEVSALQARVHELEARLDASSTDLQVAQAELTRLRETKPFRITSAPRRLSRAVRQMTRRA